MSYAQPWASPEADDMPAEYRERQSTGPRGNVATSIPSFPQTRPPTAAGGALPKSSRTKISAGARGNVTVKKTTTTVERVDRGGTSRRVETVESFDSNPRRREGPPPGPAPVRRLVADLPPRNTRERMQDPRMARERVPDPRMQRERMQDPRMSRERMPDTRMQEPRMPDTRMQRQRMQEPRMPEPRVPRGRMQDPRMLREQMSDTRMQDPRMPDTRMQRERMQEPRMPEPRVPRGRMQDPRMSREQMSDTRMQEPRMPDTRMQRERMPESRMPVSRLSTGRMQDPRTLRDPRQTRPEQISGFMRKTSVETIEQPGRTVRIEKTRERSGPGPSRPSTVPERARPAPPGRMTRPAAIPSRTVRVVKSTTSVESGGASAPIPSRTVKVVKSTTSVDSGGASAPIPSRTAKVVKSTTSVESGGSSAPIYKKRTKIVESSTSLESVESSRGRPAPPRGGISRLAMPSRIQRPGPPPSKVESRRRGEGPQRQADPRELEREVEKQLRSMAQKAPGKSLKATGAKSGIVPPSKIKTPYGRIEATKKLISKKSVIRDPGKPEIIARGLTGIETTGPGRAEISEIEILKLSPKVKTPDSVVDREVVEVTSSVTFGEGFIETSRTVSYDAPEAPPKKKPLSPQQVAQLVAEENADIDNTKDLLMPELQASRPVTYVVKRNVELELLHQESVSIIEQSIIPIIPTADEEQEEPQPEMIATIMSTEERGLNLVSPPGNMYNYLFSDEKLELVMDVASVAPAPLQDIVIPMTMQDQSYETAMTPGVLQAGANLQIRMEEPVPEDMYVGTVGKEMPKSKNTARKGTTKKTKKGPLLTAQIPPWGIKDYQPVVDLVGAPPAGTFVAVPEEDADEDVQIDPTADGIEYLLQMEPPTHSSRVQLRGSQNPSWFPGYYLALPQIPDVMTVVKSASVVFASAWKATQPDIFKEDSLIVA